MKYIITGSTGAIGSNLVPYLISKGHKVYKTISDIRDYDSLRKEIEEHKDFEYIVHLAAVVCSIPSELAGRNTYDVNVKGTYNLASLAQEFEMRFCYFSTTVLYKIGDYEINENSPKEPATFYAHTKLLGEMSSEFVFKDNKEKLLVVRPCFTYGGLTDISVAANLVKSAITREPITVRLNPEYIKDYTYMDDFSNAVEKLLSQEISGDYNVTSGECIYFSKILDIVKNEMKLEPRLYMRPELDYLKNHIVSNAKLKSVISWEPKTDIRKGLKLVLKRFTNV
jgi:nucleoside-diphosphate-sugar epimerase